MQLQNIQNLLDLIIEESKMYTVSRRGFGSFKLNQDKI